MSFNRATTFLSETYAQAKPNLIFFFPYMWKEAQGDFVWPDIQITFNNKGVLILSASNGAHLSNSSDPGIVPKNIHILGKPGSLEYSSYSCYLSIDL